jgi:hypothetical protein
MSGRAENEFGIVVCGFVEQRRCRTVEVPGKESKEHVAGDPPHPLGWILIASIAGLTTDASVMGRNGTSMKLTWLAPLICTV